MSTVTNPAYPTFRSLNAIRTALSNALDISEQQEVTSALIQGIDELDDIILALVQGNQITTEEVDEALTGAASNDAIEVSNLSVPRPEPFDMAQFVTDAVMHIAIRRPMGVVS
jgi:hypothetical protein